MTKLTLAELHQRLTKLEEQQRWVERVLEAYGIRGLWLSPAKAAPLLGVGRDRIMAEIRQAEKMRALRQQGDLQYGIHYRNVQDPEAAEPTWQVHVEAFDGVLQIPPDERRLPITSR